MTDQTVVVADEAAEATADFGGFLRSAGKLAVARQISALCLIGVVFVLPALTARSTATDFVWAYFAMLTITSLMGFGLERLAATMSGMRGDRSVASAVAPVLAVRIATIPLAVVGLWAVLAFVDVQLSPAAWLATLFWIAAALIGPVTFGALRAAGETNIEPVVMVVIRSGQAAVLAGLAAAGAPAATLIAAVALLEAAGVLVACRRLGRWRDVARSARTWRELPLRRAFALAGIDVVALLNLRADLLLVGHVLGAVPGATYGLLYRAVDGFNGVVGAAGLWLYAESANGRDGGVAPQGLRARSLSLLPRLALVPALLVVLAAGLVSALVPQLSSQSETLRILAASFPLLTVNAVELHVRSGRGRNREVLIVNTVTLLVNVPMSIGLILTFGLPGAAAALALSELLQAVLLWCSASSSERTLVGPSLFVALLGVALLVGVTAAIGAALTALAGVGAALVIATVAWGLPMHRVRRVPTT